MDENANAFGARTMGDEATGLIGVWLLRSAYGERLDTKERSLLFGENPRGVLILHESGRMSALITPTLKRDDPPPSPRQLVAYSGRYRIEPPNRFVTDVDIAWFPTWIGSAQGRNFSFEGGELHIVTDPRPVELFEGAVGIGVLRWAREDIAEPRGKAGVLR
jgi:Lipocalin-like domain